jgi:hypothetical protein
VQYTYRILGTPKTMGYADFDSLPLSALYGRSIVVSVSPDRWFDAGRLQRH